MYLFYPSPKYAKKYFHDTQHVTNRIGLFIDIFDATISRNEDVVELALVNPNNSRDFLMYYEHPDNDLDGNQHMTGQLCWPFYL